MIGEFFGSIDTRAALPGPVRMVETWQPDVVVRGRGLADGVDALEPRLTLHSPPGTGARMRCSFPAARRRTKP